MHHPVGGMHSSFPGVYAAAAAAAVAAAATAGYVLEGNGPTKTDTNIYGTRRLLLLRGLGVLEEGVQPEGVGLCRIRLELDRRASRPRGAALGALVLESNHQTTPSSNSSAYRGGPTADGEGRGRQKREGGRTEGIETVRIKRILYIGSIRLQRIAPGVSFRLGVVTRTATGYTVEYMATRTPPWVEGGGGEGKQPMYLSSYTPHPNL